MNLHLRQRLIAFIIALIFLMPSFQYLLSLPSMAGWLSNNEIANAAILIGLQIVPVFALMEFLEWRQRKRQKPPRSMIPLDLIPAFLRPACRCLSYVIVGAVLAYFAVGIIVVYLTTVVLDAPYKFWVLGLTVAIAVLSPWDRVIHSLRQRRRSKET
jgi:hypothetical protein